MFVDTHTHTHVGWCLTYRCTVTINHVWMTLETGDKLSVGGVSVVEGKQANH